MGKVFEEELKNFDKVIQRLSNMALFPKKLVVKGMDNFVREGPNIIVGNHVGSYKDIAVLFKIIPRPIFFTANKMIFSKEEFSFLVRKHLYRSMKNLGLTIHFLLSPFFNLFIRYVSTNVAKIGTIPIDIYKGRAEGLKKCQDYLKQGRAIITLQGRGHFVETDSNPYVSRFKYGAATMAYNLYEEDRLDVPVTPLAIFGTHIPLGVPGKIKVNVGIPMFISDYWIEGHNKHALVNFNKDLEKTVKRLFMEILAS